MIIKKKSMIVAVISSLVISSVLVLTLVSYVVYNELKAEEFKRRYQDILRRINAKVYSKNIEASKLGAKIESSGALKGKGVLEGVIKNAGPRGISNLLVKVGFLDSDGAAIYETIFYPQEPALGISGLAQVTIPYLSPPKVIISSGGTLPFKRILSDCPEEIINELKKGSGFSKGRGKWSGKFTFEVISIDF